MTSGRRVILVELIAAAALLGCGDDDVAPAVDAAPLIGFELIGASDLGGRGMNAALAVAGETVYVGSRIDGRGVAIVDVADPTAPLVVGEIGLPLEGGPGTSSRELRALPERDLLIVLNITCSPDLHGCADAGAAAERENLRFYDIADRRAPALLGTYEFVSPVIRPISPHELFLWRDPADAGRLLLFLSTPPSAPSLQIIDASDPTAPVLLAAWDPIRDGGLPGPVSETNILHSVAVSDDGRTGYLSHQADGLALVDLGDVIDGVADPAIALASIAVDWAPPQPQGPHSAVPVPGRDLLVVTDEVYPTPYGAGCPYGWMRMVDTSDRMFPAVVGELKLAENKASSCPGEARVTYTAHNATVTASLALVTWHAAGLLAVDITDATAPVEVARFAPAPLAAVDVEDPALGGSPVLMWSYPVVQDGLIYVVDIRNGLQILRYHGEHEGELAGPGLREGNSNLGSLR